MIAECVKRFYDIRADRFREVGDAFEVTPERFEEINGHPNYGVLAVAAATQPEPEPEPVAELEPEAVPEASPEAVEAAAEAPKRRTTTRRRKTEKTEA